MIDRLRLYSFRLLPARATFGDVQAWVAGVKDGWTQPHDLSTSTNVDHLTSDTVQDSLDSGINLGQWLRSPLNHQQ